MANEIELLAPAGNRLSLIAAVQSGADAVYIGGPSFNARAGADNFTLAQIRECADYCHLYGVDLHVAVNTLVKERELDEIADYSRRLSDAGADALIIQDLGAARLIKEVCPDIPLHASTQMTVTSAEGVKYLENMGFSRVVLARELEKSEIEKIAKGSKAEIEVFAHGALCMCYSGQCLMSSILGGRSANRGRCAQPCRLPYSVTDSGARGEKPVYALSPKDLSLIDELPALKKAGVRSIKIEGRLKRPEYVSAVTGIYRKYLDGGGKISESDFEELKNAFSRSGFTKGYFTGKTGADMMSFKSPGNSSGSVFTAAAEARARESANIRKIPVSIYASLRENDVLRVTVTDESFNSAAAEGTIKPERALTAPVDGERLKRQLAKLGQTPFEAREIFADAGEGLSLPIREINETRRAACAALVSERIKREGKRTADILWGHKTHDYVKTPLITAECETPAQAYGCLKAGADIVYADEETADIIGDSKIVVRTSDIFEPRDIKYGAVAVSSPAAAEFYRGKRLYVSHRVNAFNSVTADMFSGAELVTLSPELNISEAREAVKNTRAKCEIAVYGRLTLMLMKNCPIKALGKCRGHKNPLCLRDRKNEEFPVLCSPSCTARLINSKPIFTADKINDILSIGADALRLIFTVESGNGAEKITALYKTALSGKPVGNIFAENRFTRGHYYRGVE